MRCVYFAHACIIKLTRNTGGYLFMVSKIILSLLFGMMSTFGVSSIFSSPANTNTKAKDDIPVEKQLPQNAAAYDFSNEQELLDPDDDRLKVRAQTSTLTESGQSFSLSFTTGGQGHQDGTRSWLAAPNDDGYDTYMKDVFNPLDTETKDKMKADYLAAQSAWEKAAKDPNTDPEELQKLEDAYKSLEKHFNSYIVLIYDQITTPIIKLPRSVTRNYIFDYDLTSIARDAVTSWKYITDIYIPKEIVEIHKFSFDNAPAKVTFHCEAETEPVGYAEGWSYDAKVEWGVDFQALEEDEDFEYHSRPLEYGGAAEYGRQDENYIIGWYPKEGEQKPLIAEYCLKGSTEVKYFEFSPSKAGRTFDVVGNALKSFSTSLICDIPLNAGEEIDFSTFKLHNIFGALQNGGTYKAEPDYSKAYWFKPMQAYDYTFHVEDFLSTKFIDFSTFAGYSSINVKMTLDRETNIYKTLKPSYFDNYQEEINKGNIKIRYRLTSLNEDLCSFKFEMNDGSELIVPVKTPIKQYVFQKDSAKVSFLFKNSEISRGFNPKNVKSISILGFYVTIDLLAKKSIIARSSVITRFGEYNIMPNTAKANVVNLNLITILLLVGYVVVYAGVSVGLYFYLKNKYKNDEFRRMKTKSYVFKTILSLGGSAIVVFDILFIIFRIAVIKNAIVVYNPLDAFIIVLSVLSVVILFYFVKYVVGVVKTNRERRRVIKLKLNEDVEDDGTN